MKAKRTTRVVTRYDWAAVKQVNDTDSDGYPYVSYDVWTWNVYKGKWTRMSNHACGFGEKSYADEAAKEVSDETQRMFDTNKSKPEPLK